MLPHHPYEDLPQRAFWRTGVAESSPFAMHDLYSKKFDIHPEARIVTAGSCFAQHVSHHLKGHGYRVLDAEPDPPWLPEELHLRYGYSMYSARYGNIYTLPQLAQLAKEAAGAFEPQAICWAKGENVIDGLRPAVEPEGLEGEAELRIHRRFHLERVRDLFQSMDLFIFTLGLTEAWVHRSSGTVFPTAPGVYGGRFDEAEYEFVNFDYTDLEKAFNEFQAALIYLRGGWKMPKMLFTVSPVPLTATASGMHVLQATTYSKSPSENSFMNCRVFWS